MSKYRIMYYNNYYYIQEKGWIFWHDVNQTFMGYNSGRRIFPTLKKAREYINERLKIEKTPTFVEDYP